MIVKRVYKNSAKNSSCAANEICGMVNKWNFENEETKLYYDNITRHGG